MKFQTSSGPVRLPLPLAPLLSVAFLLLMFFMLGYRITASEREFQNHLPSPRTDDPALLSLDLQVGLRANADGSLAQVTLGGEPLGNDDAAFARLNREILRQVGIPGNPLPRGLEVRIEADEHLRYEHTLQAVAHCTGGRDPQTGREIRYVEKVRFQPARRIE